ncbi:MAG: hypothetical protein ACSHW0_19555 [Thalassotalea sp.]
MSRCLIFIFFLLSTINVNATSYRLGSLERLGRYPSIELFISPKEGNTLKDIFSIIKVPNRREIHVRLIGMSSDQTNSELKNYYRANYAQQFEHFLLDGSERDVIEKAFTEAFNSTSVYKSLVHEMSQNNFAVKTISYEKLFAGTSGGNINIPDTNITFVKVKPNKSLKQDK